MSRYDEERKEGESGVLNVTAMDGSSSALALADWPTHIRLPDAPDSFTYDHWSSLCVAAGLSVIQGEEKEGEVGDCIIMLNENFKLETFMQLREQYESPRYRHHKVRWVTSAVMSATNRESLPDGLQPAPASGRVRTGHSPSPPFAPLSLPPFPHSLAAFRQVLSGWQLCGTNLSKQMNRHCKVWSAALGAKWDDVFTHECTTLVAAKALSPKYRAAVLYNIPVVTFAWLETCFRLGCKIDPTCKAEWQVKPLVGAVVTCVRLPAETVEEVRREVREAGGVFLEPDPAVDDLPDELPAEDADTPTLPMFKPSRQSLTHIISSYPAPALIVQQAAKCKVALQSTAWLPAFLAARGGMDNDAVYALRSPEEQREYDLQQQRAQQAREEKRRQERAEKERVEKAQAEAEAAAAAARAEAELARAQAELAVQRRLEQERAGEIEVEYDEENDDYLSGLRILLFAPDSAAQFDTMVNIVRAGGGTRLSSLAGREGVAGGHASTPSNAGGMGSLTASGSAFGPANANVNNLVLVHGANQRREVLDEKLQAEWAGTAAGSRRRGLFALGMYVVSHHWLIDCYKQKRVVPFANYILPPPSSSTTNASSTSPFTTGQQRTMSTLVRNTSTGHVRIGGDATGPSGPSSRPPSLPLQRSISAQSMLGGVMQRTVSSGSSAHGIFIGERGGGAAANDNSLMEVDVTLDQSSRFRSGRTDGTIDGPSNFALFNSSLEANKPAATVGSSSFSRLPLTGRTTAPSPAPVAVTPSNAAPERALLKMSLSAASNIGSNGKNLSLFAAMRFVVEEEDEESEDDEAEDDDGEEAEEEECKGSRSTRSSCTRSASKSKSASSNKKPNNKRLLPALRFKSMQRLSVIKALQDYGASNVHTSWGFRESRNQEIKDSINMVIGSVCGSQITRKKGPVAFESTYGNRAQFVSHLWVHACVRHNRLLPGPASSTTPNPFLCGLLPPLTLSTPAITDFSLLHISSSGFNSEENLILEFITLKLGARWNPKLSKSNSHLICNDRKIESSDTSATGGGRSMTPPVVLGPSPSPGQTSTSAASHAAVGITVPAANQKRDFARKHGIPIVRVQWLLESATQRQLVPETRYLLEPANPPSSTASKTAANTRSTAAAAAAPITPVPDTPMLFADATSPIPSAVADTSKPAAGELKGESHSPHAASSTTHPPPPTPLPASHFIPPPLSDTKPTDVASARKRTNAARGSRSSAQQREEEGEIDSDIAEKDEGDDMDEEGFAADIERRRVEVARKAAIIPALATTPRREARAKARARAAATTATESPQQAAGSRVAKTSPAAAHYAFSPTPQQSDQLTRKDAFKRSMQEQSKKLSQQHAPAPFTSNRRTTRTQKAQPTAMVDDEDEEEAVMEIKEPESKRKDRRIVDDDEDDDEAEYVPPQLAVRAAADNESEGDSSVQEQPTRAAAATERGDDDASSARSVSSIVEPPSFRRIKRKADVEGSDGAAMDVTPSPAASETSPARRTPTSGGKRFQKAHVKGGSGRKANDAVMTAAAADDDDVAAAPAFVPNASSRSIRASPSTDGESVSERTSVQKQANHVPTSSLGALPSPSSATAVPVPVPSASPEQLQQTVPSTRASRSRTKAAAATSSGPTSVRRRIDMAAVTDEPSLVDSDEDEEEEEEEAGEAADVVSAAESSDDDEEEAEWQPGAVSSTTKKTTTTTPAPSSRQSPKPKRAATASRPIHSRRHVRSIDEVEEEEEVKEANTSKHRKKGKKKILDEDEDEDEDGEGEGEDDVAAEDRELEENGEAMEVEDGEASSGKERSTTTAAAAAAAAGKGTTTPSRAKPSRSSPRADKGKPSKPTVPKQDAPEAKEKDAHKDEANVDDSMEEEQKSPSPPPKTPTTRRKRDLLTVKAKSPSSSSSSTSVSKSSPAAASSKRSSAAHSATPPKSAGSTKTPSPARSSPARPASTRRTGGRAGRALTAALADAPRRSPSLGGGPDLGQAELEATQRERGRVIRESRRRAGKIQEDDVTLSQIPDPFAFQASEENSDPADRSATPTLTKIEKEPMPTTAAAKRKRKAATLTGEDEDKEPQCEHGGAEDSAVKPAEPAPSAVATPSSRQPTRSKTTQPSASVPTTKRQRKTTTATESPMQEEEAETEDAEAVQQTPRASPPRSTSKRKAVAAADATSALLSPSKRSLSTKAAVSLSELKHSAEEEVEDKGEEMEQEEESPDDAVQDAEMEDVEQETAKGGKKSRGKKKETKKSKSKAKEEEAEEPHDEVEEAEPEHAQVRKKKTAPAKKRGRAAGTSQREVSPEEPDTPVSAAESTTSKGGRKRKAVPAPKEEDQPQEEAKSASSNKRPKSSATSAAASPASISKPSKLSKPSKPVFCLSGVSTADKADYIRMLHAIDAEVVGEEEDAASAHTSSSPSDSSSVGYSRVTHVVASCSKEGRIKRSEKVLVALASGRIHVVRPEFVRKSYEARGMVVVQPHEWSNSNAATTKDKSKQDPIAVALRYWHDSRSNKNGRPYAGWVVWADPTISANKRAVFDKLLRFGGAEEGLVDESTDPRINHVLFDTTATEDEFTAAVMSNKPAGKNATPLAQQASIVRSILSSHPDPSSLVIAREKVLVEHLVQIGREDLNEFTLLADPAATADVINSKSKKTSKARSKAASQSSSSSADADEEEEWKEEEEDEASQSSRKPSRRKARK